MKKTFAILLASLAAVVLSACSAADDSTITSPRMGKITGNTCNDPTVITITSTYAIVKCEDGKTYKCVDNSCEEY